jgi:hypothetical protein
MLASPVEAGRKSYENADFCVKVLVSLQSGQMHLSSEALCGVSSIVPKLELRARVEVVSMVWLASMSMLLRFSTEIYS